MIHCDPELLVAGQQLGNLEYVVDREGLEKYRGLVGKDGAYPNLLAEDCRTLLRGRTALQSLTTVWQRFRFMRPPALGRRIQVGGWLREVDERDGLPWFWVTAFAVDEIGTEIMRSEAAMVTGELRPHTDRGGDAGIAPPTAEVAVRLAEALPGDCLLLGRLEVPERLHTERVVDSGETLAVTAPSWDYETTTILAGWLEGFLGREFADDFRWGGSLLVTHHARTEPREVLVGDAVTMGRDVNIRGVVDRRIVITVRDGLNRRVATAEASVEVPSSRLL